MHAPLPVHPLDIEAAQLETPARIADLILEGYCQKAPEAATNLPAIAWLWQSVRNAVSANYSHMAYEPVEHFERPVP